MGVPQGFYWGVDGVTPITMKTYKAVEKRAGQQPAFWGRYLVKYKLEASEIEVLRTVGRTRLLLYYNPLNIDSTHDPEDPQPGQEYENGWVEAMRAKAAADSYENPGVPDDVWIYANVEPKTHKHKQVSPDWLRGWWEGMKATRFRAGGVYGNFSDANVVGNMNGAYTAAAAKTPGAFAPPLASAFPRNHKGPRMPNDIDFGFEPDGPTGAKAAVQVWQYYVDASKEVGFDICLATQKAYDHMWAVPAKPVAPPTAVMHKKDAGSGESRGLQGSKKDDRPGAAKGFWE